MINEEVGEDDLLIVENNNPTMDDAFDEMEKKKGEIHQMRAKFMFHFDDRIRKSEGEKYDKLKQDDQIMGPPAQK